MVAPNEPTRDRFSTPKFPLGEVVITTGAIALLDRVGKSAHRLLERHQRGDYGDVGQEDWKANDNAVLHGERVLSSYVLNGGERVWIISEADRSSTCLLLPDEY
jgi:hypothetical protein